MFIAWGVLVQIGYFFAAYMKPAMVTGLWFQVCASSPCTTKNIHTLAHVVLAEYAQFYILRSLCILSVYYIEYFSVRGMHLPSPFCGGSFLLSWKYLSDGM